MKFHRAMPVAQALLLFAALLGSAVLPPDAHAGWDNDKLISCLTCNAQSPKLAVHPNGNAVAVWVENSGPIFTIAASRYDATSGLWGNLKRDAATASAPGKANPKAGKIDRIYAGTREVANPQIGMDQDGNAFVVWTEPDSKAIIASRLSAKARAWTAPVVIDSINADPESIRLAVNADGNAVAMWHAINLEAAYAPMIAARYNARTDAWEPGQTIEAPEHVSFRASVTAGPPGQFFAVWTQLAGNSWVIAGAGYDVAQRGWRKPVPIAAAAADGGQLEFPNVVMDQLGNVSVAWYEQDTRVEENYGNIVVRRYSALDKQWSAPTKFIEGALQDASMAVDRAGNLFLAWTNVVDNVYKTVAARFDLRAGRWSTPQAISGNQETSRSIVAVDAAGNAIVAWEAYDGASSGEESGPPLSRPTSARYHAGRQQWDAPVVIPSTGRAGIQPQVGMDAKGNAVAVWMQDSGGRTQDDVVWSIHANRSTE